MCLIWFLWLTNFESRIKGSLSAALFFRLRDLLSHSLFIRLRDLLSHSLFIRLRDLLSHSLFIRLIPSGAWRVDNPQSDFQELKNSVTTRIYRISINPVNFENRRGVQDVDFIRTTFSAVTLPDRVSADRLACFSPRTPHQHIPESSNRRWQVPSV